MLEGMFRHWKSEILEGVRRVSPLKTVMCKLPRTILFHSAYNENI